MTKPGLDKTGFIAVSQYFVQRRESLCKANVKDRRNTIDNQGSTAAPEEVFDVVDEQDCVVGQAPRSVVHACKLLHRAVHVFVFNTRGELLLQLRSASKDEFPLCYTSSASGHLGSGETYAAAAPRELEEELGISGPLEWLAKFPASAETAQEHTVLYRMTTDEPPRIDEGEIERVEFHSIAAIEALIDQHRERFSPPFLVLFDWYRQNFP